MDLGVGTNHQVTPRMGESCGWCSGHSRIRDGLRPVLGRLSYWNVGSEEWGRSVWAHNAYPMSDKKYRDGWDAIFRKKHGIDWSTLQLVGPEDGDGVPGNRYVGKTYAGTIVVVWKGENGEYFCHALTFGGKDAPNGPFSPHGATVDILMSSGGFRLIEVSESQIGDVIVWRERRTDRVIHSALLENVDVYLAQGGEHFFDDVSTILRSKNGAKAAEGTFTLLDLDTQYGTTRKVYRRE
jgi:hypothetical protein